MPTIAGQDWSVRNLSVQGYSLDADQASALRWGARFSTGICLVIVVAGLVAQSAVVIGAMVPIGAIAGWGRRHPFDVLWNRAVAPISHSPQLPPSPSRRRHAFKLGTIWLATVAVLLTLGQTAIALALGAVLVAICGLVTTTNYCVPSTLLHAWSERQAAAGTPPEPHASGRSAVNHR